jgi:hypothetical protein
MVFDAKLATQDAVFDALNVPALTDLVQVLQHVLEGVEPPIVVVGDIEVTDLGSKGERFDQVRVTILTYVREPAREALYEITRKVRELLEDVAITAAGADLSRPVLETDTDEFVDELKMYEGTQTFLLFAQPA